MEAPLEEQPSHLRPDGGKLATGHTVLVDVADHTLFVAILNCLRKLALPLGLSVQEREARLPNLIKMVVWSQQQLDEKVLYPKIHNFETAKLVELSEQDP